MKLLKGYIKDEKICSNIKIINANSIEDALKIAQIDPFTIHSYYPNIEVLELEEANEYLLKS